MANRYLDLKTNNEANQRPNPYARFREDPTDVVGSVPRPVEETGFAKRTRLVSEASDIQAESDKANSFGGILKETIKELPAGAMSIGRAVINDPKQAAYNAAMGVANGVSLGAVDYLERKAFKDQFQEGFGGEMSDEQIDELAQHTLAPQDPAMSAIRTVAEVGSMLVPYVATEKLVMKGLAYAAPQFIKQYTTMANILTNIGAWNAVGQINETFLPENERDRSNRALIDTALGITFPVAGMVFRAIRPTIFKGGKVSPVADTQHLVPEGEVVSRENLIRRAQESIPEYIAILEAKGSSLSVREAKILANLKANLDNPDELFKIQQEGLPRAGSLGDAKSVIQTAGKEGDDPLFVATNDVDSLQSFIKGSNEITYKKIDDLGTDLAGNKIAARHEFNPKTGKHIIYATDDVTASTLAHEMGHYFDKALTKTVNGLSRILPDFTKNRAQIEDALTSLAVTRLGGEATGKQISAEIKSIASALINESGVLSATRRGGVANPKISEQFADAVSEILTREGARGEAPVLTALLKEARARKLEKAFGSAVEKEITKSATDPRSFKSAEEFVNAQGMANAERLVRGEEANHYSKYQLTEIWNKAQKTNLGTPKVTPSSLLAEARKFKTVEEFVKGHGTPVYRGGESGFAPSERGAFKESGFSVARDIKTAKEYGKVSEGFISSNAKIKQAGRVMEDIDGVIETAKKEGFDAVEFSSYDRSGKITNEVLVLNPKIIQTRSQLTDIWNKAHKSKETVKKLDRTPTGHKPESVAFRAEKITADEETEIFLNTKILPKITSKERIGKTNEEILTRSLSSNMTEKEWNNILSERVGNLAEDVIKAKRIINDRVMSLRDGLAGKSVDDMSTTEMAALNGEYNKLVETVEVFAGVRTELSNSFRSLGIEVTPGENDVLRQVVEQIQKVLGKEGDNFTFMQKAIKLRENTIVDKYYTLWYPAILSGPKTTARNIIGTGSNVISETLSQLFSKEGRSTFLDRVNAMIGSGKDSWMKAKAVFGGDETILSKFNEGPAMRKADFKGQFAFLNNVEYVGRFLNAQDAFFSNIAREGEVAALRAGKYSYGLTDEATIATINESVAKAFGQRSTYRNQFDRTIFGEIGRNVTALKNSDIQAVKAASNFIVPFVRTIANVTDRKIDYVPFLNMFRVYRGKETPFIERRALRIVKDAGLTGAEADRVGPIVAERLWHQQMGKMYMGMAVTASVVPLAMAGRITGAGPKSKNERDTLMLKGWRPNSLILPGGIVLPYQNLGPLAGVLSMAGNIADGVTYGGADDKSITSMIGNGLGNFMRGELDQSYLAGFSDVFDMISPYSYRPVEDILKEFALNAIPVPAVWTQTKDLIFPQRFEAREFDEKILNRIGLTGSLEPKLDAFGKEMYADLIWGLTPKMLNTDDTVLNWMDENNIFIGKPNRKQTVKDRRTGEKRDMTPKEYTQFLGETGQAIYTKMEQVIKNGSLDRYKDEEKRKKVVDQIVQDIRAREKGDISF